MSIDLPDAVQRSVHGRATHEPIMMKIHDDSINNEYETIIELVLEHGLKIDNLIPESENPEANQHFFKKWVFCFSVDTFVPFVFYPQPFSPSYSAFEVGFRATFVHDITPPPPKCASFFRA